MSLFLVFPANASFCVMCLNSLGKIRLHTQTSSLLSSCRDMQSSNSSFAFRIFLSIIDLVKERFLAQFQTLERKVLPQLPLIQVAKKRPHGVISLVDSNRENSLFLVFVGHFFLGIFLQNSSPQMFSIIMSPRKRHQRSNWPTN